MKKRVVFVSPEMFSDIENVQELSGNPDQPEQREMLIKNKYALYYSDGGKEFYFEKTVENNDAIPVAKREAFEALVLFKAELENKLVTPSELEPD